VGDFIISLACVSAKWMKAKKNYDNPEGCVFHISSAKKKDWLKEEVVSR
jgi:hypothetical protein